MLKIVIKCIILFIVSLLGCFIGSDGRIFGLLLAITIATGYILSALEKFRKDDEDEE